MKKKGFTLVELLAIVVTLAVILLIAVPKISNTINLSKRKTFETSAIKILNQAKNNYYDKVTSGRKDNIKCSEVAKLDTSMYTSCSIYENDNSLSISLIGTGKYDGLAVCYGTDDYMEVIDTKSCDSIYYNISYELNGGYFEEETITKKYTDTLVWDGNTEGLENYLNIWFKVSDVIITEDMLSNGYEITISNNGEEVVYTNE